MSAKLLEIALRSHPALLVTALCACTSGCRETYVDPGNNRLPVAVARAIDSKGMPVDSSANNGLGPIFPSDGQVIEVVLDGKASHDLDGTVVSHHWLSATKPDAGAGRQVPRGEEPKWPENVPQPRVKLTEGTWSFSLWVTDDEDAVGDPDTITLIVGEPPEVDAGAQPVMCMGKACDPKVTLPGATDPSAGCCDMDNGGACGAIVDMMGACEAVDQPGSDDANCPSEMSTAGTMIAGCCKPTGKCGVRSGVLRGCIERTDYPPGFLMPMMRLEAVDCEGT